MSGYFRMPDCGPIEMVKMMKAFLFLSFAYSLALVPLAAQNSDDKIATELLAQDVVEDVIVAFTPHPGFGAETTGMDKVAKGRFVYSALIAHSQLTQAGIRTALDENGVNYQAYCVANAIWIKSRVEGQFLRSISNDPSVVRISSNGVIPVQRVRDAETMSRADVEWGLERIGADSVWSLGFRGQGVVIGGEDTGYEWSHPAISHNYRGNLGDTVDHNYNWFDAVHEFSPLNGDTAGTVTPCGVSNPIPCDDHGHGTHTMGTMVGGDGVNQIGVAPDATWVGVRCMDRGYGSPMTYIGGFEWFLAPTDVEGNDPDPAMAPDVINNSWRCPEIEGCNPDNYELMRQAIINLKAAGIVVVVSAGNEGNLGCSSLADPPSIFEESFAVGAIRPNDTIAGFSSRGPVTADSSGRIKPDVAAPGVGVRSAWLDSTYRHLNGTSMAGPHVAGTVALMISANEALSGEVELIEQILRETATPAFPVTACAEDSLSIPNNSYGYGIINAVAAVEEALVVSKTHEVQRSIDEAVIYPNPGSGQFTYALSAAPGLCTIHVMTMQGVLLHTRADGPSIGELDLGHVPAGMYLLVFEDETGVLAMNKVVIAR